MGNLKKKKTWGFLPKRNITHMVHGQQTLRTALSHSVVPQDASLNSLSNLCTVVYQLFLNLKLCLDCQEGQGVGMSFKMYYLYLNHFYILSKK